MIGAIVPGVGNPDNGLVVPATDSSVPRGFSGTPGVSLVHGSASR